MRKHIEALFSRKITVCLLEEKVKKALFSNIKELHKRFWVQIMQTTPSKEARNTNAQFFEGLDLVNRIRLQSLIIEFMVCQYKQE